MFRLSRLADYGIVIAAHLARADHPGATAARSLASASGVPAPTVSKVLKRLAAQGLVVSRRGPRGGYALALPSEQIRLVKLLSAIEGPSSLTLCASHGPARCALEAGCVARPAWQSLDAAVQASLGHLTLADVLSRQLGPTPSAHETSS